MRQHPTYSVEWQCHCHSDKNVLLFTVYSLTRKQQLAVEIIQLAQLVAKLKSSAVGRELRRFLVGLRNVRNCATPFKPYINVPLQY